ncbi:hypothetical protein [Mycobacteroides abscessus]|uniref:hypothetical protein n=1 Tax=Mycobacteroides abscessus TaxID=36809 RepID=UPI0009267AD9|nr:hypothetical protein [Mycobacteroides abscessus]SHY88579.1 Uncharacterised protein [Mycobacteroides abscessus subsp. bolletii]SHZ08658.1 Uncharacterised protein [Mycobacteroides abscessus subsp. bolletii]
MTPAPGLPTETRVRQAFTRLVEQARREGRRPSVLALARQFAMSNTTFRRHYPEIVKELAGIRRIPATDVKDSPAALERNRLVARNAKLRRANQELREHLQLAATTIARLSIDNNRLRTQLEQASKVTKLAPR